MTKTDFKSASECHFSEYTAPFAAVFNVSTEGALCLSGDTGDKLPDAAQDDWGDL